MNPTELMEMVFSQIGTACPPPTENDVKGEDGLLICGVCGEPKETRSEIPMLGERVHPVMCKCGRIIDELEKAEEKRLKDVRRVNAMFKYSIVGVKFRESTFDRYSETPDNARNLRIAKRYVEVFDQMFERNKGLLFYGDPSTGKTYLASCIANALMNKGTPLIVTSILKLTASTSMFSQDAEELSDLIRKMNAAKLLILDDLGTERTTDYKSEQVFEVIDSRYSSRRPMIITTNLSLAQMQNEKDIRRRRIFERIFEVCHPVPFIGKSWREKTAADDFDEINALLTSELGN